MLIPKPHKNDHITVCVSSQVGCAMKCQVRGGGRGIARVPDESWAPCPFAGTRGVRKAWPSAHAQPPASRGFSQPPPFPPLPTEVLLHGAVGLAREFDPGTDRAAGHPGSSLLLPGRQSRPPGGQGRRPRDPGEERRLHGHGVGRGRRRGVGRHAARPRTPAGERAGGLGRCAWRLVPWPDRAREGRASSAAWSTS